MFGFEEAEDGDYYVMLVETAEEVFFSTERKGGTGFLRFKRLEFKAAEAVGGKVFLLVFLVVGVKIFFSIVAASFGLLLRRSIRN